MKKRNSRGLRQTKKRYQKALRKMREWGRQGIETATLEQLFSNPIGHIWGAKLVVTHVRKPRYRGPLLGRWDLIR